MSNDRKVATESGALAAGKLLRHESPWALINRSLADLMSQPAVSSERVSQGLLGEACRVLEREGDWAKVRLERDGYEGFVHSAALHLAPEQTVRDFLCAAQTMVSAELAPAYVASDRRFVAGKLHLGLCLPLVDQTSGLLSLRLPDARVWWLAASDTIAVSERPTPDASGIERALRLMQRSIGVPYLWGGRTPFGYDCSGLSQAFCGLLGVAIPRDADQQFQAGRAIEGPAAPGDLVFFRVEGGAGGAARHENVRHVAISLGRDEILHASGGARSVVIDRLVSGGDPYGDWLSKRVAGVRRFVPCA